MRNLAGEAGMTAVIKDMRSRLNAAALHAMGLTGGEGLR